ncbi:hypothetical protein [Streptomyces sp. NPDC056524]|uniref:hypothetical protein n=1 Tax=Streptomyces sp. NPDC056524 TaxID=3345851 RepID=UPI0036824436
MRSVRGVGMVAAGMAAGLLLAGCGGDGGGDAKAGGTLSAVVPSSTEPWTPSPFPTTEEPTYPAGPEGEIDKLADEKGWSYAGSYDSASAFVSDMCESLPTSGADGVSRPQWLAEGGYLDGDGKAILQVGIPKMCPKWTATLQQAASGKYDRWFGDGTYVVSSKPVEGEETIPPGTYRSQGKMEDCYWERTSESGDIIDNNFATSARSITVTIRSSDGQFTSEGCEVWKPVR